MLARLRRPVSPDLYRRVTLGAVVLLSLIVVTGAAVRLTGSGLGCTDWPNCSEKKLVASSDVHSQIEFANRTLTGLVSIAVVAAVLGSIRRSPRRRDLVWLSWGLVAGVLAQIVLGGIVVLSHLNPWLVQGHFVLSILLVLDAVVLHHRANQPDGATMRPVVTPALLRWGWALVALGGVVLLTGTLVTGAGPHSGQSRGGDPVQRLPLTPHLAARIHGLTMIAFLSATIWVLAQLRRHHHGQPIERSVKQLTTVIVIQAAIGYTQYFTGVPPLLVGLHILGATLVWISVLHVALSMQGPVSNDPDAPVEGTASGAAQSSGGPARTDLSTDGDLVPGR